MSSIKFDVKLVVFLVLLSSVNSLYLQYEPPTQNSVDGVATSTARPLSLGQQVINIYEKNWQVLTDLIAENNRTIVLQLPDVPNINTIPISVSGSPRDTDPGQALTIILVIALFTILLGIYITFVTSRIACSVIGKVLCCCFPCCR